MRTDAPWTARALLAVAWVAACGDDPAVPEGAPTVELGTGGADAFDPLDDGDTMLLERGCQGAQHLWVSIRTERLDTDPATVTLTLAEPGTSEPVQEPLVFRLRFPQDGTRSELRGIQLVVTDPDVAIGKDLDLRVTVAELEGSASVTVERSIHVEWSEDGCGT